MLIMWHLVVYEYTIGQLVVYTKGQCGSKGKDRLQEQSEMESCVK
jgi:hypothetical protein